MGEFNRDLHFSTGTDKYSTPADTFEPLARAVGGFDTDPAASEDSDLAATNYTEELDGLAHEWRGNVFCNPPYSELSEGPGIPGPWFERMADAAEEDYCNVVVGLVPNRTSTQWYQQDAYRASYLCGVEGRLTFSDADNSAPFPSLIAVFGDCSPELLSTLLDMGTVSIPLASR